MEFVNECDNLLDQDELHFDFHDNKLEPQLPKPEESIYGDWNLDKVVSRLCFSSYKDEVSDWMVNSFDGYHYDIMNGDIWKANPVPWGTDASEVDYQTLQPHFVGFQLI